MEDINDMLAEQQLELERIRKKRNRGAHMEVVRNVLNWAFLLLAIVGIAIYFRNPEYHVYGMIVIGIGMILKIAEFFIRFMF
ncbi:MAG: hypothetical protein IJ762_00695 [Bacteroidaceae bacterium]|nr:hypothetical protein [Bacteroidaceae bacterium]MBR1787696.1 hypothetical protein [Bacteroidaceae bacterium]